MEEHLAAFLEALRNRAVSEHTLSSYESDLRDFEQFLRSRQATIDSIDYLFLRDFLNRLYQRKLQKTSVARKLACLRTFFKFLVHDGRLKSNPAELISSPRLPKKLPSYLGEEEAAAVVEMPQGSSLKDLRDRAILELLYASGLRVRELVGLNDENLDMPEHLVRVFGKGKKQRIVPFGEYAARALATYLSERDRVGLAQHLVNGRVVGRQMGEVDIGDEFVEHGLGARCPAPGRDNTHTASVRPPLHDPYAPPYLRHSPAGTRR